MMFRTPLQICLFVVLTFGSTGKLSAQVKQIIHGSDRPWEYEFIVDSAAEAQPSLRFRILPDPQLRKPGNAAISYYRALHLFNVHPEKDRKEFEECINFGLMIRPTATGADAKPVESISIERVAAVIHTFSDVLQELQISATCEKCEWGGQTDDPYDSINMDFSEFVSFRRVARLLHQKARIAIVNRDYEGAFETIQIAFQLARNVAKFPRVIHGLLGAAISKETQVLLMEIVANPKSPNLYWALASAPSPFIDMHPGLEDELNLLVKLPLIRDAEQSQTEEKWQQLFHETIHFATQVSMGNASPQAATSEAKLMDELQERIDRELPRVKAELAAFGISPERIAAMPALQAIAIHEAKLMRYKFDDVLKSFSLPYHEAVPLVYGWDESLRGWTDSTRLADSKEVIPLLRSLAPPMIQVLRATNSLDRLLVRTRVVEALRMHAAVNHGNLPTSLSEITVVPIPMDPTTGKPIIFRLDGNTAILELPADMPSFGEIVRVTVRKDKPDSPKTTVDSGAKKLSTNHKAKSVERTEKVVVIDSGTGVWEKLKGKWTTVKMEESGKDHTDEVDARKHTLAFDTRSLIQTLVPKTNDPETIESAFRIDASKTPWEMDWFDLTQKSVNKPNAEKLSIEMMGIFELNGDALKIHFVAHREGKNMKGDPVKRPTDFKTTVEGAYGDVLLTLQRVKP